MVSHSYILMRVNKIGGIIAFQIHGLNITLLPSIINYQGHIYLFKVAHFCRLQFLNDLSLLFTMINIKLLSTFSAASVGKKKKDTKRHWSIWNCDWHDDSLHHTPMSFAIWLAISDYISLYFKRINNSTIREHRKPSFNKGKNRHFSLSQINREWDIQLVLCYLISANCIESHCGYPKM